MSKLKHSRSHYTKEKFCKSYLIQKIAQKKIIVDAKLIEIETIDWIICFSPKGAAEAIFRGYSLNE